jgi:hypothetical protein
MKEARRRLAYSRRRNGEVKQNFNEKKAMMQSPEAVEKQYS